ncbi:MAG: 5-(carboxyamino)imidazole ribonucleotide mutase [Armatimonadetes bacterium]|nr:5-(carboxyamino)imidazole ribonucleotide mutase [Armatimonadota bacterium]
MTNPIVGIVMGSDSDLPVMEQAAHQLESFDIPFEIRIISAHRAPREAFDFATSALGRGLKVVIAGAGGAAHLPGVIAGLTILPVIGVPIESSSLNGVDSLYSIVQMPSGVPVATVAVNAAKNAAILAAEILATSDNDLRQRLLDFKEKLELDVKGKDAKLQRLGWKDYK